MSSTELATSPSVLISENYWQRRFAGDPAVLGRAFASMVPPSPSSGLRRPTSRGRASRCPISGCRSGSIQRCIVIAGFCGTAKTSVAASSAVSRRASAWMRHRQRRLVLASQLRAVHEPNSELSQDVRMVISPGSPLPGINAEPQADHRPDHGRGRDGAGHRLRQCRRSATGARDRPSAGARHASLTRRQPIPADSATGDRERPAGRAGRLAGASRDVGDDASGRAPKRPKNCQPTSR